MKKLIITAICIMLATGIAAQISIIGTATPAGNFDTDFYMAQDAQNPDLWGINIILTTGEVKFRQDGSWAVNWGGTTFPDGIGYQDGPNIIVDEGGDYYVTLNTSTGAYQFSIIASGSSGITHQAVIRNAANEPVTNQSIGVRVSVIRYATTGPVVYSETHNPTSNANGLITFVIGHGAGDNDFLEIDWANGPYFLKTEADPAGGNNYTITGTSQFLSVPYALHAGSAGDNQWEQSGNNIFSRNTGNVGIGSEFPNSRLFVTGWASNPAIPSAASQGILRLGILQEGGIDIGKISTAPFSMWMQAGWNGIATDPISLQPLGGNIGIGTTMPSALLHTNGTGTGEGNVLFMGEYKISANQGDPPTSEAGTRMMWYPDKAAFRAGRVYGADWDKDSIGDYSMAMGLNTKAKGLASVALGASTVASGANSTTSGFATTASGDYSTAFGIISTASGYASNSFGFNTSATAGYATAFGFESSATGSSSTAVGHNAVASGHRSVAIGNGATASGWSSTAMGNNTNANGSYSTAMGGNTTAYSAYETVIGRWNFESLGYATDWNPEDRLFIIGNGSGPEPENRNNAFTVMKNGNVAIGTYTPYYKLDINGTVASRASNAFRLRQNSYGVIFRNDNNSFWTLITDPDDPDGTFNTLRPLRIELETGNVRLGNVLNIEHSGNVGIGVTTAAEKLDIAGNLRVRGSNGSIQISHGLTYGSIGTMTLTPLALRTNNADRLLINSAGNVGIGTDAPTQKLDINGQVRIRGGSAGEGKVLTSDADGTASWQHATNTINSAMSCIDIDGNAYPTIIVGTQIWMAENLRVTKYRNGNLIPNVTNDNEWWGLANSAYCWYDNDEAANKKYGLLYNWFAVNDTRGLCPTGWRVPTEADWTVLTNRLGGTSIAGGKMKAISDIWHGTNTDATNSTGFSAIPGGLRNANGGYGHVRYHGFWWSSTVDSPNAWYRHLAVGHGQFGSSTMSIHSGLSVRCVKDID